MKCLAFDTESSDLAASWGRILCASFVDIHGGDPYTFRYDDRKYKGKNLIDDSRLCVAVRDELEDADIVIGWNSILHDIPLLNARLSLVGERPCRLSKDHGTMHLDLMFYAGGATMKVGGRKLDTIAKFFKAEAQKTPLDGETWQLAAVGDKQALDTVVEHCEFDVLVLRDLWAKLAPGVKRISFNLSEVWPFLGEIPSRKNRAPA